MSTPASRFKRGRTSRAQEARISAALRDGPSDAELDAALAQLANAPLPVGFVARTVERATGWPRFRIQARDLWLPVATGLGTATAVAPSSVPPVAPAHFGYAGWPYGCSRCGVSSAPCRRRRRPHCC